MFHIDDDSIVTILSFTDPFSLTSFEGTSQNSRRLVHSGWIVLDKDLAEGKWEGGDTPRQRVLSSFAVHGTDLMSRMAQLVEDSSLSDLSKRGIDVLAWEKLDGRKHLVHLRMSGLTSCRLSPFEAYCESTISITPEQIHSVEGSETLVKLSLTKDLFVPATATGKGVGSAMSDLLDRLYATGTAENTSFQREGLMQTYSRIGSLNDRLDSISIVAFDRLTLAPSILFKEDDKSGESTSTALAALEHSDGYFDIEAYFGRIMTAPMKGGGSNSSLVQNVMFNFHKDSFDLVIGSDSQL